MKFPEGVPQEGAPQEQGQEITPEAKAERFLADLAAVKKELQQAEEGKEVPREARDRVDGLTSRFARLLFETSLKGYKSLPAYLNEELQGITYDLNRGNVENVVNSLGMLEREARRASESTQ